METRRHLSHISEMLYVGMCCKIGTPTEVKIRRDVKDTQQMIYQSIHKDFGVLESGSCREGFRLATSDRDTMIWVTNEIVICDLSQIPPYHPQQTLILMECHDTPPGFAKLQLLTQPNNVAIRHACVSANDNMYISSSLYRERTQSFFQLFYPSSSLHGPCSSGFIGPIEFDFAYCFSCKHWPPPAYHWMERSQIQGWPTPQVLQDIISDGCHLVAIGSGKSTSPQQCETEWRISFSQAEYKLVSSMNHTQFLCYGTLKIFLKEVLNAGLEHPLLCSYFVKTTLFWKIQETTNSVWNPTTILHFVWMCFKYLIQCVYKGELLNFFIPQSNMFINKIHGAAQKQLFLHLMNLYNMGFSCLLLSPSLHSMLSLPILFRQVQVRTDERDIISEAELDIVLHGEISAAILNIPQPDLHKSMVLIIDNLYKITPKTSQIHIAILHEMRNFFLLRHAFYLEKLRENNIQTTDSCSPLDMLMSVAESGFISDALYVGMYLYNKSRYTEALHYIERTKQKLSLPYVLHIGTENVNKERYMETVGGKSFKDKIREAGSREIFIDHICCIEEVRLEVCVVRQSMFVLIVPPMVMTHMLSFLCHHRLGDRLRSRQSLNDLQNLIRYDEVKYIRPDFRDISWQMLGICEQIFGDKERALYSYEQAYNTSCPFQKIKPASWTRMKNIISK